MYFPSIWAAFSKDFAIKILNSNQVNQSSLKWYIYGRDCSIYSLTCVSVNPVKMKRQIHSSMDDVQRKVLKKLVRNNFKKTKSNEM